MGKHELLIRPDDAVLVVDITYAFLKGGGLPVPGGDDIVEPAARVVGLFPKRRRYMVVDSHPRGHISLASSYVGLAPYTVLDFWTVARWESNPTESQIALEAGFTLEELYQYLGIVGSQRLWPDHGLIGTKEGGPHDLFKEITFALTVFKGTEPARDGYSAFRDNAKQSTRLGERMRADGIRRLFICGLALDYCVGWSALDSVKYGFETFVMEDLTRGIADESVSAMKAALAKAGVRLVSSESMVFP